jgi:hypothetical protein
MSSWNSAPNKRTCGVLLTSVPDTAAPSKTTLPADVFGPGSLIVVDIVYNYTPIFGSTFTKLFGSPLFGTIPIARSAAASPQPFVFLVTDGADNNQYYTTSSNSWTGSQPQNMDPTQCKTFKNRGITVSVPDGHYQRHAGHVRASARRRAADAMTRLAAGFKPRP